MLVGLDLALVQRLTVGQLRQTGVVLFLVVAALVIDLEKTVELHHLARGAKADLRVGRQDIDRRALHPGGGHLAGQRALPDQVIEAALIGIGQTQAFGIGGHIGRADTLMRLLGVLGLVLIDPRRIRHIGRTEPLANLGPRRRHGLRRHVDAIGPHVGDKAGLIQPLSRVHRRLGAKAKLAAGLLLQGRGHEGRIGVAGGGLRLNAVHRKLARVDGLHSQFGGGVAGQIELVELLAAQRGQPRLKLLATRGFERGGHGPKLAGAEGLNLHLAFDNQPQANRLHPARRFRPRQFAPQNRRQGKAHQIIQRTAGKISLNQGQIDLARLFHRLGDGIFGNGVEGHARHLLALLQRTRQRLFQVP